MSDEWEVRAEFSKDTFCGALTEIHDYGSESTLGLELQSGKDRIYFFGFPKERKAELRVGGSYFVSLLVGLPGNPTYVKNLTSLCDGRSLV